MAFKSVATLALLVFKTSVSFNLSFQGFSTSESNFSLSCNCSLITTFSVPGTRWLTSPVFKSAARSFSTSSRNSRIILVFGSSLTTARLTIFCFKNYFTSLRADCIEDEEKKEDMQKVTKIIVNEYNEAIKELNSIYSDISEQYEKFLSNLK